MDTSGSLLGLLAAILLFVLLATCLDIAMRFPANSHTVKTLILQYLITRLLIFRGYWVHRRFLKVSKLLDCNQEMFLLQKIINKNKDTFFGKNNNFSSIKSKKDYVKEVPLSTYEDYCQYFTKLSQSTPNLLQQKVMTYDPVVFLATSSGTTGKNKILPLTPFTKKTAAFDISPHMMYMSSVVGGFHMGRVLVISYSAEKVLCNSGLYKGPVSSHIGKYLPHLVVPREVYYIHNEVLVLHLLAVFALSEPDVCQIEALFSTLVYSFWRHIEHFWPMICRIIESGKLEFHKEMFNKNINHLCTGDFLIESVPSFTNGFVKNEWPQEIDFSQKTRNVITEHLDPELLSHLESCLRPNPARADELRTIFKAGFEGSAKKIWPSLKYVRMINTGGFSPHATLLRRVHLQSVLQLSLLHAASEGFFGLNLTGKEDWEGNTCYAFQPEYGFFEFIHVSDIYSDNPKTCFIEDLIVGNKYEIVYTSQTGLYRYKTGDVIKIVGSINRCPTYVFKYRKGQVLNLFWEKTPEYVLNKAVEDCIRKIDGPLLVDFIATEDLYMPESYRSQHPRKHYVLFIEVSDVNGSETVVMDEDQLQLFDKELMNVFELYATLRKICSIGKMNAIQLKRNSFSNIRRMSFTPQRKFPRVTRDQQEILALLECILK